MQRWASLQTCSKPLPLARSTFLLLQRCADKRRWFRRPFWVGFLFREIVADVTEIRFDAAVDEVSVLDGYCSATGKSRTDVMRSLLKDWSGAKLREATLICRVAGVNPTASDAKRSEYGT